MTANGQSGIHGMNVSEAALVKVYVIVREQRSLKLSALVQNVLVITMRMNHAQIVITAV